MKESLLL